MKALRTMTPEQEGEWAQTLGSVPTKGHVYYVLHESGLTWPEIEAFFGIKQADSTVNYHVKDICRWCQR